MGVEEEPSCFGTSLPVQSVQEIVKNNPKTIPERYIRSTNYELINYHESDLIPTIDLSLLTKGDETELKKLDMACMEWGFFQLVNHGMLPDVLQRMKSVASEFFQLPLERKKKYAMSADDIQGYGQLYVTSEHQKLDWADLLVLILYPVKFRKICFWPTEPNDFTEAVERYSEEVNRVAKELLSSLSVLMRKDKEKLLNFHKEIMQAVRVNYYPTCCDPEKVMGVSPHSDSSTFTILLQDDEVTGLQILHCGSWVPCKPIPNALVVNVGDVLEVLSNGRYKSIEHRAMTNQRVARMSVASFICPQDDVEIEPMKEEDGESNEGWAKYGKMRYGEYLKYSMERKMDGKSHIQLIKLGAE